MLFTLKLKSMLNSVVVFAHFQANTSLLSKPEYSAPRACTAEMFPKSDVCIIALLEGEEGGS